MDAVSTGGKGSPAKDGVVVLADSEDRPTGGMGEGDGCDTVIGPRRQVDDDVVDLAEHGLQALDRPYGDGGRARTTHKVSQPGGPDQVVREDGDTGGQSRVSARWWKTSRAVTTPVGRPCSMIGM